MKKLQVKPLREDNIKEYSREKAKKLFHGYTLFYLIYFTILSLNTSRLSGPILNNKSAILKLG